VLTNAKEGDSEIRVIAINSLTGIKSDAASTIPVLIDALQNQDVRVQRAAATALVRFGPAAKSALPILRTTVVSDDADLRLAAAQAILAIEKTRSAKDD
jgi:HEAT repeat protein